MPIQLNPNSQSWQTSALLDLRLETKEIYIAVATLRRLCETSNRRPEVTLTDLQRRVTKLEYLNKKMFRLLDQVPEEVRNEYSKDALALQSEVEYYKAWATPTLIESLCFRINAFILSLIPYIPKKFTLLNFYGQVSTQFKIVNVGGDGSCGFRAVARALVPDIKFSDEGPLHEILRTMLVEYLKVNADRLSIGGMYYIGQETLVPFEDYIKYMSMPHTFADELAMKAFSEIFKRPIYIYSPEATTIVDGKLTPLSQARLGEEFLDEAEPIHLLCMGNHFQCLYPKS